MDLYKITYYNQKTGIRESYMNNTAFAEKAVNNELRKIKERETKLHPIHRYRTRWRKEKIKIKNDSI